MKDLIVLWFYNGFGKQCSLGTTDQNKLTTVQHIQYSSDCDTH